MNTIDERVQIAAAAIEKLEDMHDRFMKLVQSLSTSKPNAGSLGVSDNNLTATCLGVSLTVKRKIVVRNSYPAFIEYAFIVTKNGIDIFIFAIYLGKDGSLLTDLHSETRLCDFDNAYLPNNLLNAVAIRLLDSEVFKPTTNSPHRMD